MEISENFGINIRASFGGIDLIGRGQKIVI